MIKLGVEANAEWSLFCPNEAPGLDQCYGEEFEALYLKYEQEGKARRSVNAQKLWFAILDAQIETGMPYMLYKGKILLYFVNIAFDTDHDSRCMQ